MYLSLYMHFYMICENRYGWSERSTLVPFSPFIRHPLSKFTLRPWLVTFKVNLFALNFCNS